MSSSIANWTTVTDLNEALDQLIAVAEARDKLANESLPFSFCCHTVEECARHSAQKNKPVPTPIAAMYGRIGGFLTDDLPFEGCVGNVFLWDLSMTSWLVPKEQFELEDLEEPYTAWLETEYFAFGQGIYGDTLVYCPSPPSGSAGSIIMLDHEGQGPEADPTQPCMIVFLADSLAQWLSRWTACGFEEYGYVIGDIPALPIELQSEMKIDHKRLNPGISWW